MEPNKQSKISLLVLTSLLGACAQVPNCTVQPLYQPPEPPQNLMESRHPDYLTRLQRILQVLPETPKTMPRD